MSEELKTNSYWKSLNELSRNEEYKKFAQREFPEDATEMVDQVSRRSFLRVMGASIALAGFASCRRPAQTIVPFSRMPEDRVEGEAVWYATAHPFQDVLNGLLVQNTDGRPTKIEGNEQHPSSGGRSSIYDQAELLGLYDPDRSRSIRHAGEQAEREALLAALESIASNPSQRVAVLSEANSSLTVQRLRAQLDAQYENLSWTTYEPFDEENELEGARIAFGERLRAVHHFGNADVVVTLDSDVMNPFGHKNATAYAQAITARRDVQSADGELSRIYAVESTFSNTGSYADNRLRLKASQIAPFTYALAAELAGSVDGLDAFASVSNEFSGHNWIATLASDLLANRGGSALIVGAQQPEGVHAAVAAINLALGNVGETVEYVRVPHQGESSQRESLAELADELVSGSVDTLLILGGNPVANGPSDLNLAAAIPQAGTVIHLSRYVDETSKVADWHVNRAHFLEAWGDGRSFSGVRSIVQPQIQPLFGGWSEIELLAALSDGQWHDGHDLVQETWQEIYPNQFEQSWNRTLHDGLDTGDTFERIPVALDNGLAGAVAGELNAAGISGIEIAIKPDPKLFDGRYANNSWLQELPDPMTKITWDNVALMSPTTARELGVPTERHLSERETPVVQIQAGGQSIEVAAWVQPGHADGTITLTTGYGRTGIGRVADGVGVSLWNLVSTDAPYTREATVSLTGRQYEIACVQDHNSIEGRDMIREATMQQYRENPDFATYESVHGYAVPGVAESEAAGKGSHPMNLFDARQFPDDQPQWGMAIDLNACFGCGVCTIACQAENNIPVVGKREVSRRRMLHWIRTDRYYEGDEDNPRAMHQPVPCMHCDQAPCEQVCPVAATTQSEDGMNSMTYNRCVGTRYCANNCPFKVRRFNFFNYSKEFLTTGDDPEIVQMAMNPDVTVRFRGVMEKCTYCVQRVNKAKRVSRVETGSKKPADGTVQTACQQACPANAIHFGDMTDPDSRISQIKRNERNYVMLEELSIRPRTSYLGKLRNPNPQLG
ncbi:MAG: TAT-variant-translocated molybdopterin oxidoreductase [Balneolaceae bacterium]